MTELHARATRAQIVEAARSYLGIRFRHQGRDKSGLDCVGLLVLISRDCGLPCEDLKDLGYRRAPDPESFRKALYDQTDDGNMRIIRHGSLLMLRQPAYPCHCGVADMVEGQKPMLIHASIGERAVVSQPLSLFMPSIVRVREFRGVI